MTPLRAGESAPPGTRVTVDGGRRPSLRARSASSPSTTVVSRCVFVYKGEHKEHGTEFRGRIKARGVNGTLMSEAGKETAQRSGFGRFKMEPGQKGRDSVASRWKSEASSWRGTPPSLRTPASASLTGWSTRACAAWWPASSSRTPRPETTAKAPLAARLREQGLLADRRDR